MEISQREAEVLAAIGAHQSNAQIANRMHISVRTVESHVSALLRKFGVADRRALAAAAGEVTPGVRPGRFLGLPPESTSFVGRTRERGAVMAALGEARLVTLLGPGGMGKTRLAAAVARIVAEDYPAGGAFVDLVPASSVITAVGAALGVIERPGQPLDGAVFDRLRRGGSLLVLDNCEHLIDQVAELVGRVLAECPLTIILATSRERLAVPGEHIVDLPALPEAAELFRTRAGADFAAPPEVVDMICARVDGMPLAIELAAARARSLGAEGLLAVLEDRRRLLTGGRGVDPRHRSLEAVIDWSHDLLDDRERVTFRRLAVFAGSFDLDAAAAVHPELGRAEVADLVGRLVDKSLIVHSGRWRLLDTIRAFAWDQVSPAERDELHALHLAWAANAGPANEILDDLRAALARTPVAGDPTAHRLARNLAGFTFAGRHFLEARAHYRSAALRAPTAEQASQDLRAAADAAIIVADGRAAFDLLLEEADLAPLGNARAYAAVTSVRYWAPIADDRRAALLDGADPADPMVAAAHAWHARVIGAPDVLDRAGAAVAAARRAGDPVLIMGALDVLATVLADAGRLREAHAISTERLAMLDGLVPTEPAAAAEIVDTFHMAAKTALGAGDLPGAREILDRAGDPVGEHPYITAPMRIRVLALSGDFDEAIRQADAMWEGWLRDGCPYMPWMSTGMAVAAMSFGFRADSRFHDWRTRALKIGGSLDPGLSACLSFVDARVAVHLGHTGELPPVKRTREPWWVPYAVAANAELAVTAKLPDAAEHLRRAEPVAAENAWAAACLTRARGRLTGDPDTLVDAAAQWERLGARFEHECTVALLS